MMPWYVCVLHRDITLYRSFLYFTIKRSSSSLPRYRWYIVRILTFEINRLLINAINEMEIGYVKVTLDTTIGLVTIGDF